ncbi:zinc ribbon protein [Thermosporothrix hazakensis]|uniref:Zinc ribbon protein n=1 Tax=Thermosporothrix hazakensis TaxID=644383 RepID=A0A326U2A8_THEHA|nr:zinc ribbon domain-containing protein [Thermosporothrix hazakensis]PZW25414.1 zinc ribbon protein [Thermosporothrix hazakensis]GCE48799.1 hypothetical protein KTH_36680 [Thermosporothrix hazakensis]
MKCTQCGESLQPDARFCPKCGATVHIPSSYPFVEHDAPTQMYERTTQGPWNTPQHNPAWASEQTTPHPAPAPTLQTPDAQPQRPEQPHIQPRQKKKPNRLGCTLGCLTILVLIIASLIAAWVFAIRPYAHNMAYDLMDQALTRAEQNIPSGANLPPTGLVEIPPFHVTENTLNNMIVLNMPANSPIAAPTASITPSGVRLSFTAFGTSNAVSCVPIIQNGHLKASNVTVEGPFGLIMSADEITSLINKHFQTIENRIQRPIQSIQLKQGEVELKIR